MYGRTEKASEVKTGHFHWFSANSLRNSTEQTKREAQRECEMQSGTGEPTAQVGRGARTRKGYIRVWQSRSRRAFEDSCSNTLPSE